MQIHFHTTGFDMTDAEKALFTERMEHLRQYLGSLAGDGDLTSCGVRITKTKHDSGDALEVSAHISTAHDADFTASVTGESMQSLASELHNILKNEIVKHKEERTNKKQTPLSEL